MRERRGSCRYPGAGTRRDYPRSRVTSVPTCRRGLGSPGSLRQMSPPPQLPLFLYPDSPQMLPVAVRAARVNSRRWGALPSLTPTPLFTLSVRLGKQSSRRENKTALHEFRLVVLNCLHNILGDTPTRFACRLRLGPRPHSHATVYGTSIDVHLFIFPLRWLIKGPS